MPGIFSTHLVRLPSTGIEISVSEAGKGSPLVFIHGLSANSECWKELIGHLGREHRCICIDLPGHGNSQKACTRYSISLFTQVIKEVIELLRLEKPVIIGHSMGGQTAIKLAVHHPSLVSKLVLFAPAGFERFNEKEKTALKEFTGKQTPESLTEAHLYFICSLNYADPKNPLINEDVFHLKKLIQETGERGYLELVGKCIAAMLEEPVYHDLPLLTLPVKVLFGENDRLIPNKILHPYLTTAAVASDASSRLERGSLTVIPGAGHFLQREKPLMTATAILEFLNAPG